MMIDKKKVTEKKTSENKTSEITRDSITSSQAKIKTRRGTGVKNPNDKELKIEEEPITEDNTKLSTVSSTKSSNNKTKNLKSDLINVYNMNTNSTPKSGSKVSSTVEKFANKPTVNSFSSNISNLKSSQNVSKATERKSSALVTSANKTSGIINLNVNKPPLTVTEKSQVKKNWTHNINAGTIITNLENCIKDQVKEKITSAFWKIHSLEKLAFFNKLMSIKKQMNDLLQESNHNELNDYHPFLLRYIEGSLNQINTKLNRSNINTINLTLSSYDDNKLDQSNFSDDGLIDYIYHKNNSVSFEIPVKRERAMSEHKNSFDRQMKVQTKFANRTRLSSEEISKRMKEKLENAEKNKNMLKLQSQDNVNKLMSKINEIKIRKKKEKQENKQRLVDKLERYNIRHQQFLNEKASKAKSEQEKVAEVNFLNRLGKENRDLSIIKKLNISIERRENYIMQKLNKTMQRNLKEEAVEKKRKTAEDELKNKVLRRIEKNQRKKDGIDGCEDKIKVHNKIEIVNKRKVQLESEFEFLKNVYSENFIWELVQADYFDVDVLNNLTSITKFEIMKAKLKKDKDLIDMLYDKKDKSKLSHKTKFCNGTETIYSNENENNNLCFNDLDLLSEDDSDKEEMPKRSKSFTKFSEDDYFQVDYLFKDTAQKKRRKKKKKPQIMKDKVIKSINSMSQTDWNIFFSKINKDKKIKKFLIKSHNGRYIKSKLIVRTEEIKPAISEVGNSSVVQTAQINATQNQNQNHQISPVKNSDININININNQSSLSDDQECENSDKEISFEDKKEKFIRDITDVLNKNESGAGSNTIMINSESLSNILEKNALTIKWCKLCNMILPNDQDTSIHISKQEHKRLKIEYGISLQEDSSFIMVFQSLPGDISEDFKNERINAIKHRLKKVKQKMSLRAVKHENFWSYKQDFPSNNKQRLQKISFEVEKQTFPNIKDYESLENNLKDLIKIIEQKKQNDLHIMRGLKVIHCLVEILKKPAVCHKSEIKNLGKIIELVVKILMYFSALIENRNYMVVTNRMSVIADLLLWVLNKPSKIPLGISFLPDIIYLITIHIKHRIPFEYLAMKDDFLEYLCLSNTLIKFRQRYTSMVGPIDLTSGFGSFPLVLLKSLGMIEALTFQININYCSKPVYVKNSKISENVLFVLEYTELVGIIQLLTSLLLSNGPIKPKPDKDGITSNGPSVPVLPQTVISATILGVKVLNNIARLDLSMFQNVCNYSLVQEQLYHIFNYIINYSLEYAEGSDDLKELLHETILMMSYISLLNEKFQNILSRGEVTVIQRLCSLPFSYFCEKKLKEILFPTILAITYKNDRNLEILNKEINMELLTMFLKEKIQLEPIIEEVELEKLDESREEINFNLIKMGKDQFISVGQNDNVMMNANMTNVNVKKRTFSVSSTASSTKSCHDMLTGVSDYIPMYHRFPRNLWEKALDYYSSFAN